MAIDIFNVEERKRTYSLEGQLIHVYGKGGTGKTYVASRSDKPLYLAVEAGANAVSGKVVDINEWGDFVTVVEQLTSDSKVVDPESGEKVKKYELARKMYNTVVIDGIAMLKEFCIQSVLADEDAEDIGDITGKKNGYLIYRKRFLETINKLLKKSFNVITIGHEEIVKLQDALGREYEFVQPQEYDKQKDSLRFAIYDNADLIVYVESNGTNEEGDTILSSAYLKETKTIYARNRNFVSDAKIDVFTWDNLKEVFLRSIKDTAEMDGAEITDKFSVKEHEPTADELREQIMPLAKKVVNYDKNVYSDLTSVLGSDKVSTCKDVIKLRTVYNKLNDFVNTKKL